MIHAYLRFFLAIVFWIYYRKVHIRGLENIPADGPIILACNHPNSFLDALVVGTYTTRRIYFLARADVFISPLSRWILGQTSLLPVYRVRDEAGSVGKNLDTFAKCFEILDRNAMILIFSEGLCIQELRLRPLKKGTARIALEYAKDGKHLKIVPVGLNYLKPRTSREELILDFGVPFDAADFSQSYRANAGKAIVEFNRELNDRLQLSVINIRDKTHERELTQVLQVEHIEGKELPALVASANDLHNLQTVDPQRYEKLVENARNYSAKLEIAGVDDRTVKDNGRPSLLMQALVPFYLIGRILNGIPFLASRWVAKTKVRTVEFYDSIFLCGVMFLNQFYLLTIGLIALAFDPILSGVVPAVMLVTGWFSAVVHDSLRANALRKTRDALPRADLDELLSLRKQILDRGV